MYEAQQMRMRTYSLSTIQTHPVLRHGWSPLNSFTSAGCPGVCCAAQGVAGSSSTAANLNVADGGPLSLEPLNPAARQPQAGRQPQEGPELLPEAPADAPAGPAAAAA